MNELERPIGTYLYGRRMYEAMVYWETVSGAADQPAVIRDFAEIWRAAVKTVFSRTLQTVASARTHIERTFDPDAVRRVKEAAGADITIGGAEPAGQAIAAGLVDESHLGVNDTVSEPALVQERERDAESSGSARLPPPTMIGPRNTTALAADRDDNPA